MAVSLSPVHVMTCACVPWQNTPLIARVFSNRTLKTIIIIAKMAVVNVAGYLIEERRRWPVITAWGQYSK